MADIYNSSNIVGAIKSAFRYTVNTSALQYAQGGFFNVTASTSTEEDSQGTGFSVASTTVRLGLGYIQLSDSDNLLCSCRPLLPELRQGKTRRLR